MNKFLALVTVITLNACDNVYDPNMLAKIQKIESDANNIVLNSKCSNKNEIESKALQITAMVISANEAIKNGHVIGLIQYHNSAIQTFNNIKELDEKCRDMKEVNNTQVNSIYKKIIKSLKSIGAIVDEEKFSDNMNDPNFSEEVRSILKSAGASVPDSAVFYLKYATKPCNLNNDPLCILGEEPTALKKNR